MDSKSDKPLRFFVNPLTIWAELAFKTGQAMWASASQAAAARPSNIAPKVAVIPTADAPAPEASKPAPARQALKAVRPKAPRAKVRSKAHAKRRAKR